MKKESRFRTLLSIALILMMMTPFVVASSDDTAPGPVKEKTPNRAMANLVFWNEDFEGYDIGDPIGPMVTAAAPPPGSPSGTNFPGLSTGSVCAHHVDPAGGSYWGEPDINGSTASSAYAGNWIYMNNVSRFDILLFDFSAGATLIEIALQNDNNVYHWPGGVYTQIPGITWSLGTWHEVFIDYDEFMFTYSVWWDGNEYAIGSGMIPGGANAEGLLWFGDSGTDTFIDNGYHWKDVGPVHNVDTNEYFNEIQTAIDDPDTLNGHTIEVAAGTYYENVVVDKRISIIGEDRGTTVIDAGGIQNAVYINAWFVNLTGFTLRNPHPIRAALKLGNSGRYCTIVNNTIIDSNIGIYFELGGYNEVVNNLISNNTYGLYALSNGAHLIRNNFFTNNTYGIYFNQSDNNTITKNTIQDNGNGIYLLNSLYNEIYHNILINNFPQAYDSMIGFNNWDDGYPSGGNYWSDYSGEDNYSGINQDIPGCDGIGDDPYYFNWAYDYYPLMLPYYSEPSMSISKWAPATATQSEMISYWINYSNTGGFAHNATVTEIYPPEVTFVSAVPSPDAGNNIWMLGDIPLNGTGSIAVTVMVGSGVTDCSIVVNNITLYYENSGGIPTQKYAEASTLIIGLDVDLTFPDGGELWKGGGSETILWDMSDDNPISELTVDITYSTDGGLTFPFTIATALTGYTANPCTYAWNPIDSVDSTAVKVRVVVMDTSMNFAQDQSPGNFTIDSTPPEPVTNVRAELEGTGVRVYWDASVSMDVDRYEVWWGMNSWDPTGDTYVSHLDPGLNTDVYHACIGVNNPGSYFYQVRVFDIAGHETRTSIQAAKYGSTESIIANPTGWFLLGSPLVQSDTSLSHVLQGQGFPATWDCVRKYDDSSDTWLTKVKNSPVNDLTDIYTNDGFWIHLTTNSRFAVAGYVEDKAIQMYAGWNLVAYPFAQRSMTISDTHLHLLANCPGYAGPYPMIADPTQPYQIITPTGTENIFHNQAFWVPINFDCTWHVQNY
jgi:parallel beta-helix repeat protein